MEEKKKTSRHSWPPPLRCTLIFEIPASKAAHNVGGRGDMPMLSPRNSTAPQTNESSYLVLGLVSEYCTPGSLL